jgi:hypothetical protein
MSEKRANMLIKAIVEIEQACNNTNETHSEIWQIAYDAIRENAEMVAEMPANVVGTRTEPALPIQSVMPMFADDSNLGNEKREQLINYYNEKIPNWEGTYSQGFADCFNWLLSEWQKAN